MKTMTVTILALAVGQIAIVSRQTRADEKFDPAARAKAMAPWIDEQTFAVAHFDVRRVKIDEALDAIGPLNLVPADEIAKMKIAGSMFRQGLIGAGVKDVYVYVAMTSGRPWLRVFAVIPLEANSNETVIRGLFGMFTVERSGDVLLIAGDRSMMMTRVTAIDAELRPELAAAVEAAGDSAAQVLLLPPKHWKRVLEEGVGEFPHQFGGGSINVLTRGALWIAVGIDLAPHTTVHLTIQSEDASAAAALQEKLAVQFKRVAQDEAARRDVPKIDEAVKLLTPTVEASRLHIDLDEANHGVERVMRALAEPLELIQRRSAMAQSQNNLKQIALAMQNYHSAHKHFPLPGSVSAQGKPLLSWRVEILPFIEESALYKEFHLDEAWDSPHNRALIAKMPNVYRDPAAKHKEPGRTNYLLPIGNGAGFTSDKPTEIKDITDGTSNTIMIVEVDDDHAAIWTKPDDWQFGPNDPGNGLGRFSGGMRNVAFFDGSVRSLPKSIDPKTLKALFTRAAGEVVEGF